MSAQTLRTNINHWPCITFIIVKTYLLFFLLAVPKATFDNNWFGIV